MTLFWLVGFLFLLTLSFNMSGVPAGLSLLWGVVVIFILWTLLWLLHRVVR